MNSDKRETLFLLKKKKKSSQQRASVFHPSYFWGMCALCLGVEEVGSLYLQTVPKSFGYTWRQFEVYPFMAVDTAFILNYLPRELTIYHYKMSLSLSNAPCLKVHFISYWCIETPAFFCMVGISFSIILLLTLLYPFI